MNANELPTADSTQGKVSNNFLACLKMTGLIRTSKGVSIMRDTLDIILQQYGLRLTTSDLARILKTSPAKIRNDISANTFPIRTYKQKECKRALRYADARDVAEYLDQLRQKAA